MIAYLLPLVVAIVLSAISKFAPLHLPSPYQSAHVEYHLPSERPSPSTGVYQTNRILENAERLFEGKIIDPETLIFDREGTLFLFAEDGIYKSKSNGTGFDDPELFVEVKNGRPISGVFDSDGNVVFCDAIIGLCKLDVTGRSYEVLVPQKDIAFCDDVVLASNGDVFIADASAFHVPDPPGLYNAVSAIVGSGTALGRVLKFSPSSGNLTVLLKNITLASGLELSADESYLLVSDSSRFQVKKLWIKGPKEGLVEYFLTSPLPGWPDGVSKGSNSTYWIAITVVINKAIEVSLSSRLARWLALQVPPRFALRVMPIHAAIVQVDSNGKPLRSFHDASGKFGRVASVVERNGKLYIGSFNNCIKVIKVNEITN